jgi:hypothetical protein
LELALVRFPINLKTSSPSAVDTPLRKANSKLRTKAFLPGQWSLEGKTGTELGDQIFTPLDVYYPTGCNNQLSLSGV